MTIDEPVFSKQAVEAEYRRLQALSGGRGYQYGWSFLGSPEHRLATAKAILVGLNPGGAHAGEGIWDFPGDLAHVEEKWGNDGVTENALQQQIRHWLRLLELDKSEVAHVNFVPFRSPDWQGLPHKDQALAFAARLWGEVLRRVTAGLFITFGKTVAANIAPVMEARRIAVLPVRWGDQSIDIYENGRGDRIVAMPHPSRFTILGRQSDPDSEALFRIATTNTYRWSG